MTGLSEGRPLLVRRPSDHFTLSNLMRAHLYASVGVLKIGNEILFNQEHVKVYRITAHGGLFKIPGVAQQILADAFRVPVTVLSSAGEGGAWGMSLLAAYMTEGKGQTLADWLDRDVFSRASSSTLYPGPEGAEGFDAFMANYENGLRLLRQI